MADISKFKLPGGEIRGLKDAIGRSEDYTIHLQPGNWQGSGPFTYVESIPGLRANHPPIIQCIDNDKTQYAYITRGDAETNQITFSAKSKPTIIINLKVIDIG